MKIENINIGFCEHGKQFVCNWTENGSAKYFFSSIRFVVENVKNKLEKYTENSK